MYNKKLYNEKRRNHLTKKTMKENLEILKQEIVALKNKIRKIHKHVQVLSRQHKA